MYIEVGFSKIGAFKIQIRFAIEQVVLLPVGHLCGEVSRRIKLRCSVIFVECRHFVLVNIHGILLAIGGDIVGQFNFKLERSGTFYKFCLKQICFCHFEFSCHILLLLGCELSLLGFFQLIVLVFVISIHNGFVETKPPNLQRRLHIRSGRITRGKAQLHFVPVFAGILIYICFVRQGDRAADVRHPQVIYRRPARAAHEVAQLKTTLRSRRSKHLHGDFAGRAVVASAHVVDLAIDLLEFFLQILTPGIYIQLLQLDGAEPLAVIFGDRLQTLHRRTTAATHILIGQNECFFFLQHLEPDVFTVELPLQFVALRHQRPVSGRSLYFPQIIDLMAHRQDGKAATRLHLDALRVEIRRDAGEFQHLLPCRNVGPGSTDHLRPLSEYFYAFNSGIYVLVGCNH